MKSVIQLLKSLRVSYYNGRAKRKGLAQILTKVHFEKRDKEIQGILNGIRESGNLVSSLKGFNGRSYDERIVEYPYLYSWLERNADGDTVLDVGCVLNNHVISNYLSSKFKNIWFCNPALEPVSKSDLQVFYHVSTLDQAFSHSAHLFKNITCLSTIEHIGYDNSHYGVKEKALYNQPNDSVLIDSILKLASLLDKNGNLLVSVPFGKREVLRHPITLKGSSQVFDSSSVAKLTTELEGKYDLVCRFFKASDDGWDEVGASDCDSIVYAQKTPASGAVWMIEVKN